jgi:hypothetical protein
VARAQWSAAASPARAPMASSVSELPPGGWRRELRQSLRRGEQTIDVHIMSLGVHHHAAHRVVSTKQVPVSVMLNPRLGVLRRCKPWSEAICGA